MDDERPASSSSTCDGPSLRKCVLFRLSTKKGGDDDGDGESPPKRVALYQAMLLQGSPTIARVAAYSSAPSPRANDAASPKCQRWVASSRRRRPGRRPVLHGQPGMSMPLLSYFSTLNLYGARLFGSPTPALASPSAAAICSNHRSGTAYCGTLAFRWGAAFRSGRRWGGSSVGGAAEVRPEGREEVGPV